MTDALEQEIRTVHALQAEAQEMDERAQRWAQVSDRLTTRLAVIQAEERAGVRDQSDTEKYDVGDQKHNAEAIAAQYRGAANTIRSMTLRPPSALVLSDGAA